jgi:alkylhydroperoxidase family enzyme
VGKEACAAESDASAAAAVLRGCEGADAETRDQALSVWALEVARNPTTTTAEDIDELRAAGLSDQEIFEATVFAAFRLAFSTVNNAGRKARLTGSCRSATRNPARRYLRPRHR